MRKLDSYNYIVVGLYVRALFKANNETYRFIAKHIDSLLEQLQTMQFEVSIQGLTQLNTFRQSINSADTNIISDKDLAELHKIMLSIEWVVFAEAKTKHIYIISQKRFNVDFLLNFPDKLFAPNIFLKLPEISQFDIKEGFKCIAFNVGTAAAFHLLRATEGVLKSYYLLKIKMNREKKPMWDNMVKGLRGKKRNPIPEELLNALDNIKNSYRNPTAHPEKKYDVEEAQDLLGLCLDVINKMMVNSK